MSVESTGEGKEGGPSCTAARISGPACKTCTVCQEAGKPGWICICRSSCIQVAQRMTLLVLFPLAQLVRLPEFRTRQGSARAERAGHRWLLWPPLGTPCPPWSHVPLLRAHPCLARSWPLRIVLHTYKNSLFLDNNYKITCTVKK